MNREQVVALLRKARGRDEELRSFASRVGVTPQYISDIWQGRRDPGKRILKFLGLAKDWQAKRTK